MEHQQENGVAQWSAIRWISILGFVLLGVGVLTASLASADNGDVETWTFDSSLESWEIDRKPADWNPSCGSADSSEGEGGWSSERDGSIRLYVNGGPEAIGAHKVFDGLQAGDEIRVDYAEGSPDLDGEAGKFRLVLVTPDCEKTKLDTDQGRPDNPDTQRVNGTLLGTIPEDMPADTHVWLHLQGWPINAEIFVEAVKIGVDETSQTSGFPESFEDGDFEGWTSEGSPPVEVISPGHEDSYAVQIAERSDDEEASSKLYRHLDRTIGPGDRVTAWIRTDTLESDMHDQREFRLKSSSSDADIEIQFQYDELHWKGDKTGLSDPFYEPDPNTWYKIELEVREDGQITYRSWERGALVGEVTKDSTVDPHFDTIQITHHGRYGNTASSFSVDDIQVHRSGESPAGDGADVQTTSSQGAAFEDTFEEGSYDAWSEIWWDSSGCSHRSPDRDNSDDWQVVTQPALEGEYTLEHNSRCGSTNSGDTLATNDFVLNPSEDFEVSFEFYFEDSEHRGAQTFLVSSEEDGSKNGDRVDDDHRTNFFRLHNPTSSKSKDQSVQVFGQEVAIGDNDSPVTAGDQHTARLVHEGSQFVAYMDGEELATFAESEVPSEYELDREYRFAFAGSGNWGSPSTIWYDTLQITHANAGTSPKDADGTAMGFQSGLEGWTVDRKPVDWNPSCGSADSSRGEGGWSSNHDGSIRLYVNGGPEAIGAHRAFDELEAGEEIRVDYAEGSPNLEGEAGKFRLVLVSPDCEKIKLDTDQGRPEDPETQRVDGTLKGNVPRDMPAGTHVWLHLQGWPINAEVFVTKVGGSLGSGASLGTAESSTQPYSDSTAASPQPRSARSEKASEAQKAETARNRVDYYRNLARLCQDERDAQPLDFNAEEFAAETGMDVGIKAAMRADLLPSTAGFASAYYSALDTSTAVLSAWFEGEQASVAAACDTWWSETAPRSSFNGLEDVFDALGDSAQTEAAAWSYLADSSGAYAELFDSKDEALQTVRNEQLRQFHLLTLGDVEGRYLERFAGELRKNCAEGVSDALTGAIAGISCPQYVSAAHQFLLFHKAETARLKTRLADSNQLPAENPSQYFVSGKNSIKANVPGDWSIEAPSQVSRDEGFTVTIQNSPETVLVGRGTQVKSEQGPNQNTWLAPPPEDTDTIPDSGELVYLTQAGDTGLVKVFSTQTSGDGGTFDFRDIPQPQVAGLLAILALAAAGRGLLQRRRGDT